MEGQKCPRNARAYRKRRPRMIRGRNGIDRGAAEESYLSNCRESTARGMFSWSGEQVDSRGGCALYMMARNTAETVGMYAVLLRASSHVSPISRQSRLSILLVRSLPSPSSPSPPPPLLVPFLPPTVSWENNHIPRAI